MAQKWKFLIINGDGEVKGTDDESAARDMAAPEEDNIVLQVSEDGSVALLDTDFEPSEIPEF